MCEHHSLRHTGAGVLGVRAHSAGVGGRDGEGDKQREQRICHRSKVCGLGKDTTRNKVFLVEMESSTRGLNEVGNECMDVCQKVG